jgi:cytochrome c553
MNRPARHRLAVLSITAASALCAPAAMANEALLGRNLAATCANCHGTDGKARGDMKTLAGTPADKLVAMMNDYRSGNLPATIMHQIAKGYTDQQIRLIAAYFAAQKPAAK